MYILPTYTIILNVVLGRQLSTRYLASMHAHLAATWWRNTSGCGCVEGGVKCPHYIQTDSFRPAPRHVTQPADCTQSQLFFHSIQIFSISADEVISSVSAVIFPGHYLCGHQHNSGEAAGTVQFLIVHTLTWRHTGPGLDTGQFHSVRRRPLLCLSSKIITKGQL